MRNLAENRNLEPEISKVLVLPCEILERKNKNPRIQQEWSEPEFCKDLVPSSYEVESVPAMEQGAI